MTVENEPEGPLPPLSWRIREILQIAQGRPLKRKTMLFLIMYDIEDDRVRTLIARYLLKKGCIRIQKSVYIAEAPRKVYEEIAERLRAVNELYTNEDSILLIPLSVDEVRGMRVIGKDIDIRLLTDPPNLLFV